ncbi:hypothetical protein Mgra_00000416 [Meloidogyne graminicola]|uniref:Uncharacterized protein n=1 Tax=Meloidogyne graminicola TaxID=189291 RepID=A0A8T0A4X3_9BILA|nr:hypothetical protein Mgra_00000416 [Meloidogyne graminicola]
MKIYNINNKDILQYSNAFNVWKLFVENTQSTFGILFLIEFLFKNCEGNELKRNIVLLWNESKTLLTPNEFIAYLIIGMMKTGYIEEANIFAKKILNYGN